MTDVQKPQTITEQLFGGKGNLALWGLLLVLLIIGLIGTFWDLADANILGTGQGLDAGSAGLMIAAAVVVALFFLGNVLFGKEMRAKRGLK